MINTSTIGFLSIDKKTEISNISLAAHPPNQSGSFPTTTFLMRTPWPTGPTTESISHFVHAVTPASLTDT